MKLSKIYEPQQYEPNIYALWETSKAFAPGGASSDKTGGVKRYSIVMPPPNANGNLHIGHALMAAVEDILIRYHRMKGESVVWIPGADHAGFETWVVFEQNLETEGKSRFDYTREQLYRMVWDFVAAHRGNMELQLRELGASCDWDSLVFTLDKNVIDTSYKTFKKLWDEGLIYRGERPVNFCTKHQTGFSDIEVEYQDMNTPLYYIKYGPFTLATTRPETKFGDTGIAVHPDDERYQQYIGKELKIEGVNGTFTVKVVADPEVDPQFGTGAVKVTPAHSLIDWDIAQRHNLPAVQIIEHDGRLNDKTGRFKGMTVLEARAAVVEALKEKGLLVKVDESYRNRVGVCYKCKTIIEPMLMDQWFLKMEPLAKPAIEAIKSKAIRFYPESKGRVLVNYLKNIRDWNLSRQTPWGIPIPAFQNVDDPEDWHFDTRVEQETIKVDGKTYKRDNDTFDTWFSSGQWPIITTQHNPNTDLSEFYPTTVMETGHDILFPWVSRMIMFGLYLTDKAPFKEVYLHGLVLDPHGQKMSKSKGNVLNPQEIVTEYGSDALRMGLIANRSAGVNQAFSQSTVVAGRNFANKLWNMARYIEGKLGDEASIREPRADSLADHWVLSRLEAAREDIENNLQNYRFAEAFETLYHLVWNDVADWYIESSKVALNKPLLGFTLETILRLAHPFAPFVTETIWQTLAWEKSLLIGADWPQQIKHFDDKKALAFAHLQELITETRFVARELGGKQTLLFTTDELVGENRSLIQRLAGLEKVEQAPKARGLRLALAHNEAWLDVDEQTLNKHRTKLEQRLTQATADIKKFEARLANDSYTKNAPTEVVGQTRDQLKTAQALEKRLKNELTAL